MPFMKLTHKIKSFFQTSHQKRFQPPIYRVLSIEKNKVGSYFVNIQIINKGRTFKMSPENILSNDKLTNSFSPCDVRTLTYLGYLGINGPTYKILAKRLSENDKRLIFVVGQKGKKESTVTTAAEILKNKDMIKAFDQNDAQIIGYTAATEDILTEHERKQELLKASKVKENQC